MADIETDLFMASVGSCSCEEKSGDANLHGQWCNYRVLHNSWEEIKRLQAKVTELTALLDAVFMPEDGGIYIQYMDSDHWKMRHEAALFTTGDEVKPKLIRLGSEE